MLKSMTGYARSAASNEAYEVVAEIRSVNHRFLEIRVRVQGGAGLASYEKRVRDRLAGALARGKVDVSLQVKPLSESAYAIEVDRPLMGELVRLSKGLKQQYEVAGELSVADLIAFTPAFQVRERNLTEGEKLEDAVDRAVNGALESLESMRASEGAEMEADLDARTKVLAGKLDQIEKRSAESREEKRQELEGKVAEILGSAAEPNAVAAEVARLVERADIAEEITRFRSHLTLWKSTVEAGEPCGKKLDFIVQEMNREVNTIGSKCQDAAIAERVIAMKSELERVREQVQNVE